jgi:arylsulfatase A-like enzyme
MKRSTCALKSIGFVFLLLLIGLPWGCGGSGGRTQKTPHSSGTGTLPNIVLIIIDALRADKLGCCGFPGDISPEIDALAKKGVLFERVIAQCSWTRPSIASMITSLYPRSIGIYKERYDVLPDECLTLAEILKNNGYHTYGITANPNINTVFNFHQGFDDYKDSSVIWGWMKAEPGKKKYKDHPFLPRSGEIFNKVLEKAASYDPGSGPVYVQINIMEVHSPHIIRPGYRDSFIDYPVKKINVEFPIQRFVRRVRDTLAAVRQVSHDIGEFVGKLASIPGWENTLIIITSDHGQGLDDHPDVYASYLHGNLLYESQTRVPLILYHMGNPTKTYKPHRVKKEVRLLDLMPTLLDYVGISPPKHIHGCSLLNLIKEGGDPPPLPEFFTVETNWRNVNKIAIYSGKWKYIENRDNWKGVNPQELQPMGIPEDGKATDKIHEESDVAEKMKRLLSRWENRYRRARRTISRTNLSREEIDQLKSLGYLK